MFSQVNTLGKLDDNIRVHLSDEAGALCLAGRSLLTPLPTPGLWDGLHQGRAHIESCSLDAWVPTQTFGTETAICRGGHHLSVAFLSAFPHIPNGKARPVKSNKNAIL